MREFCVFTGILRVARKLGQKKSPVRGFCCLGVFCLCLGKNGLNFKAQTLTIKAHPATHLANLDLKTTFNFVYLVLCAANLARLPQKTCFNDSLNALLFSACDVLVVGHGVCFVSFDVSNIQNYFLYLQIYFALFRAFFLSDSVATEIRVRLVESDRVAHGIDSVVKLVDGFIQLLAVLILLPFVVA